MFGLISGVMKIAIVIVLIVTFVLPDSQRKIAILQFKKMSYVAADYIKGKMNSALKDLYTSDETLSNDVKKKRFTAEMEEDINFIKKYK